MRPTCQELAGAWRARRAPTHTFRIRRLARSAQAVSRRPVEIAPTPPNSPKRIGPRRHGRDLGARKDLECGQLLRSSGNLRGISRRVDASLTQTGTGSDRRIVRRRARHSLWTASSLVRLVRAEQQRRWNLPQRANATNAKPELADGTRDLSDDHWDVGPQHRCANRGMDIAEWRVGDCPHTLRQCLDTDGMSMKQLGFA